MSTVDTQIAKIRNEVYGESDLNEPNTVKVCDSIAVRIEDNWGIFYEIYFIYRCATKTQVEKVT